METKKTVRDDGKRTLYASHLISKRKPRRVHHNEDDKKKTALFRPWSLPATQLTRYMSSAVGDRSPLVCFRAFLRGVRVIEI